MRLPSVKSLSRVFSDPKRARAILKMSRAELVELPAGAKRVAECYRAPETWDLRMHCLNSIEPGLYGVESFQSTGGEWFEYLNAGETYAPTLYRWRGNYRVGSWGDFVENPPRGVHFE